jgi:TRAP-type C4-dicarboxylate transport system permease small subunit
MRRFLNALYLGAAGLAALFVLTIAVLMVGQSIGRGLGWRTGAINDIVAWCCAAAAFLAMAHAFKHGDFVRVTLGLEKASPPVRRALELFTLAVGSAATAYLAWWASRFTYESWEFNDLAQGLLPLPLWIPQLSFAFGSILLFIAVLDEFIIVLRGDRPTYVTAVEQRHAQGDFSADL